MSSCIDRAGIALYRMVRNMYNKGIELPRITKCSTQLLMAGFSSNSIPNDILCKCLNSQNNDGGWVSVADTIWNTKFLSFYREDTAIAKAISYLNNNRVEEGFGRSKRDIGRIPVTGIAFYLLPELANEKSLNWLEDLWISEKNGLTYKAAYTLMAFRKNDYIPHHEELIIDIIEWLISQQESDGGFAPWKDHPVGTNIYCTSVALIGLIQYFDAFPIVRSSIDKAYLYICRTQLSSGLWPYHELEDGSAWGLAALTIYEGVYGNE